jgi:two-component system, chemotaxis family, response regulator Rcp1
VSGHSEAPGRGSSPVLSLPREALGFKMAPAMKRKVRILLAEDNPGDVFLVKRALDFYRINYELSLATNGEEAISLVHRAEGGDLTIDLMLVDLNLPRYDGGQVVAAARASTFLAGTPIIILTSSDSPYDRSRLFELGASLYFRKPADLMAFMEVGRLVQEVVSANDKLAQEL